MSGVRIIPSKHDAELFAPETTRDTERFLRKAAGEAQCKEVIQSSFDGDAMPTAVEPSRNGLVEAVIQAYSEHRHLKLRPDDIWCAILSQLSLYINENAEELRSVFVAHKGKEDLVVKNLGTPYTVDQGYVARQMADKIQKKVVDLELKDWILPDFSTTTDNDTVVASILMMCSMQAYFRYVCPYRCGIPSVTLLGERTDYEEILRRLDKLDTFGTEAAQFNGLLRPILLRFLRSFDDPTAKEVVEFWQQIVNRRRQGSGEKMLSGWITAFMFWNKSGVSMHDFPEASESDSDDSERSDADEPKRRAPKPWYLTLDDATYHEVDQVEVPPGWGKVPVTIDDNGDKFEAEMLAGSVGIMPSKSTARCTRSMALLCDTVQPVCGWWIYRVGEPRALTPASDD